jgi:MFS family permease
VTIAATAQSSPLRGKRILGIPERYAIRSTKILYVLYISGVRPSPYTPVLRDRQIARLLPGFALSYLGDGMSAIAVSWLALQIAPAGHRGLWVALAVAAYTFPSVIGTFALAGRLRNRPGAQLVTWDSWLRAACLGTAAALSGVLGIWPFVALLAASSVLHAWGSAGTFTMVTELLPERDHLPANALLGMLTQVGVLIGPAIAGLVIAARGPGTALGIDALTFAVLALSGRRAAPVPYERPVRYERPVPSERKAEPSRLAGFRLLAADRRLGGLLALTFAFYALYGPFEVGLPVYVADYEHAPASHLAWYFTAFGAGAVVGGLVAGYLRSWPLGPATSGIVIGVGAAFLPLGLGVPDAIGVACFAVAGLIYAPYGSLTTSLFQRATDPASLSQVLAARRTVLIASGPVGTGLGGLLVTGLGARPAFLIAAVATVALGLAAAASSVLPQRRHW